MSIGSMYETAILNGRFYGILAFEDNRDAWRQIWTSDGTVEGTTRGPDMPCASDFARLRAWNGWLYCVGLPAKPPSDGSQVYQLWKRWSDDRVIPSPKCLLTWSTASNWMVTCTLAAMNR